MERGDYLGSHKTHKLWHGRFKSFIPWLVGLGFILLLCFIIVIFALVIVDFTRENNLESEFSQLTNSDSVYTNFKKGVFDYLGKDSSQRIKLFFLNKYKFNDTISLEGFSSMVDYFNQRLVPVKDPSDYLYDTESKFFIIQGKIEIKKRFEKEVDILIENMRLSFDITSNMPVFSAIKLAEVSLDTEKSHFLIKRAYSLCTNEPRSEKRCDKYIGPFYNDYRDSFEIKESSTPLKDGKNNNKKDHPNKFLEEQMRGHYTKKPINEEIGEIDNDKNKETEIEETVFSNEIEHSTIYVLIFFMNENELLNLNKTKSIEREIKHKNSLGRIVFLIELEKK